MINLPANPGLARRLAYSNYIRSRTQNSIEESIVQRAQPRQQPQYGLCLNNTTVEITTIPFFCPVCQDIKENSCISRHLSCGHTFHIECIEYWLKDNTNCPMCRKDLQ